MLDFAFAQRKDIRYGYFPALAEAGILCVFTCRQGGASALPVGGLNMALHVGDDAQLVRSNRALVAQALGLDLRRITTCQQVHGTHVTVVDSALIGAGWNDYAKAIVATDALMTNLANVPLMLCYADCVPVVLLDRQRHAIALIHAGWRGSVAGICAITAQRMMEVYGSKAVDLEAYIGPSIGPCCFEVGEDVQQKAPDYCLPHGVGHYLCDLWQLNTDVLLQAGLLSEHVYRADYCTYHHTQDYFSYRGDKVKTGRMGAIVMMRNEE